MSEKNKIQSKRDILYRKAKGKIISNNYIEKINELLLPFVKYEIVSIEKTDLIISGLNDFICNLKEKTKIISSKKDFNEEICKIKNNNCVFYILIDDDWKYCGALAIDSMDKVNDCFYFGGKILNDVVFISETMSMVFSFDFFEESGGFFIDFTKWSSHQGQLDCNLT